MNFLQAQWQGLLVGLLIVTVWAALDWIAKCVGIPVTLRYSYVDVLFAASAGASIAFLAT